ncbi:hypothetical protein H0E87_009719 [Populus deltoides]|uniref:Cullin N-terminal domain-containing protein n=1 Tax=Populus deltoides TaxID=3696 RepID=A0A8T2YQH6_POPDE|nr:hypothetical protein H0E87_009719 [Populus deltoides]
MDVDMMLNEKLKMIDDAITKKKTIMDCHPEVPLTPTAKMNAYEYPATWFYLHVKKSRDYSNLLYEKYTNCLTEIIQERALPVLLDKHGTELLTEVMRLWSEYEEFASFLSKIFAYLDRYYIHRKGLLSLADSMRYYFCNLIIQEREGGQIMLAEVLAYYSQLSLEWWFWGDSFSNYLRKVDWCLNQEETRARTLPIPDHQNKNTGCTVFCDEICFAGKKRKEVGSKQNAEGMATEDRVFFNLHIKFMMTKIIEIISKHQLTNFMQEPLSKYASLKLE